MPFIEHEPKRYQDCRWPTRLWRRRHYLRIPWLAWRTWRIGIRYEDGGGWNPTFRQAWQMATGLVQVDMNWLYDLNDVIDR